MDPTAKPEESGITIAAALDAHLGEKPFRPTTEESYRYNVDHYLARYRNRAVTDLSRTEVRDTYDRLRDKCGQTTATCVMRTLRTVSVERQPFHRRLGPSSPAQAQPVRNPRYDFNRCLERFSVPAILVGFGEAKSLPVQAGEADATDLIASALATLKGDFSKLGVRIRVLEHEVPCACAKATIRVHYPALRDGKATVQDLTRTLTEYLTKFALPRTKLNDLKEKYGVISVEEFSALLRSTEKEARNLFIKANKATNRNGEGGELLLYLLTEWILGAPQVLAKMPLKTSSQVAIHGADGVHIKYSNENKSLVFFWGESKLYADVNAGIASAAKSIADALSDEKLEHEFNLISRNIDFTGLSNEAKAALLSYLDPNDEHSNARVNVTTCLIGFDLAAYAGLSKIEAGKIEESFRKEVLTVLPDIAQKISEHTTKHSISEERFEIFLFPIPSVQEFRDLFQAEIGWIE